MNFPKYTLFFFLFLAFMAHGSTFISGEIDTTTFDVKKNPYIVEKDIVIPNGKSITIPEGIVLLFHPFTGFKVEGRLVVQGSSNQPVIFTSIYEKNFNPQSEQLPNPFDWNGIFITKDADGAFLNHFSLKYSVYGVKSQCKNIIIQNAMFQQNGQFHFTVNEQIQYVQDNIPFSYGDSSKVHKITANFGSDINLQPTPKNDNEQKQKRSKNKIISIFSYSSLSIGIAGGIAGAIFAVNMKNYLDKCKEITKNSGSNNIAQNDKYDEFNIYKKKYNDMRTAIIVSSVVGGLGLAGFGISIAF